MLILTRKIGEKIIIGDNRCAIEILAANRHGIRLGFVADNDISIYREEVYRKKMAKMAIDNTQPLDPSLAEQQALYLYNIRKRLQQYQ